MAEEIGVAYLSVKPKMDGNFDSEISNHGSISGGKFGGAFAVAAGNLIASGIEKVISGAFSLLGDAFSNYANFEQLSGGVEKIFDQADISGIMKDANEAYKTLNMSANEYLEAINQTGAAFAATMGDQKGYDTAKQGMQAIADYASGTGRNLDELNEKYALITRATSSYQSIADQFSGILPATSADFLAQAQAAGFLSGEYTKLTEVPIAEYQQAVSAMLEKGVSDMGLYQNTFNESTETISGSLAMLTSSWQNFTTELGKDSADMPARTSELVDSIVAVVQNIAPRLLAFAQNLFAALPTLYEQLSPYIQQFIDMAAQFIEEHQPEIQAASAFLFDGIKTALKEVVKLAIQALGEFIKEVIVTFPEWFPQLLQAAGELFMAIVEGLVNGIDPFMRQLEDMMNQGLAAIGNFIGGFFTAGFNLVSSIIGGIGSIAGNIVGTLTSPFRNAFEYIISLPGRIIEWFSGLGTRISNAFGSIHFPTPHVQYWDISVADWHVPIPYISWYAKGGIVDDAQLIGAGERGAELIWPSYGSYFDMYAKGIAEHMPQNVGGGGVDIHDCTFIVRKESDIRAVAVELNTLINRQTAGGIA